MPTVTVTGNDPVTIDDVVQGVPWSTTVTVVDAKLTWPSLDDLEVRSEVRDGPSLDYALIADLRAFMDVSFDGDDLVIAISASGSHTRAWRSGYYDIFVSDVGTVDARAIRPLHGEFVVASAVTAAS